MQQVWAQAMELEPCPPWLLGHARPSDLQIRPMPDDHPMFYGLPESHRFWSWFCWEMARIFGPEPGQLIQEFLEDDDSMLE